MFSNLKDRLNAARRQRFVGRTGELELFRGALESAELPFHVLYIFGPGGVGKTTLLSEFTLVAEQAGADAFYLDGRNVEASPDAFLFALRALLGLGLDDSPAKALAARVGRHVLLVDTYEALAGLDGWLRDTFLPQLPETTLVVLAGRNPLNAAWRADPGWQVLLRAVSLRNLTPDEGSDYLSRRRVPADQHGAVLSFTHCHPLALSLVADSFDQRPGLAFEPEAAPDMVKVLLEQFVQKVPGPAHRAALEACALVRLTNETLLCQMLNVLDGHELFEWLRGLSFIESRPGGLFPHDLAREALALDVRWRNPDWYAQLHKRAREYYTARMGQVTGLAQQETLFDLVYLHRDSAMVRPFLEWQASGSMLADAMQPGDMPALLEMVTAHEGEESARLAAHWFARQPQGVLVLREPGGRPAGFLAMARLHLASEKDLRADPAAATAWRYLNRHAPLRAGEAATLFRFWMARETYQAVSPVQSVIFISVVRHYLTTPGLAFTFFPCSDAGFWAPMLAYADLTRLPDADYAVGGRNYGVYGHDWRVVPPAAWLALLAEREIAASPESVARPVTAAPLLVLSQPEFAASVREALRDFHEMRAEALRGNPLLRSRIVSERAGSAAGDAERTAALRGLIRDAAQMLQATPRDAKLHRALHHTFFQPAATQEQAAEIMDIPFSTYRRHLKAGIARITDLLWQQEIGR